VGTPPGPPPRQLQSCLFTLLGLGADLGEGKPPSLADPNQQERVDDLLERLHNHRDSVEFLGLTLNGLIERVELPPGEAPMLQDLLVARLGPVSPDEPLAGRLSRSQRASADP